MEMLKSKSSWDSGLASPADMSLMLVRDTR